LWHDRQNIREFRVSDLVTLRRDGNVGVVTVDNPPVNAIKTAVRVGLIAKLGEAKADPAIAAVVLACAGRTFMAGADISEFGKPMQGPATVDVIAAVEQMGKPVVAALHGTPLGGGLEISLGCHFRLATPGTRLGQPEIKIGTIPGAGGTQRLPRLVGIEKAMAMILTGDPITAPDALAHGLVDEIVDGDVTAAAIAFARRVVAEQRPLVLARDRDEKLASVDRAKFDDLAAGYLKRGKGLLAPMAAIESLRNALDLSIDDALRREWTLFLDLLGSEQAKSQRHIFFAEREAAKIAGIPADTKPREIKRAAIIGAGTMGGGIAMCFANAGLPVTVVEMSSESLARGLDTVARNYRSTAARGGLKPEEAERRIGLIAGTTDMAAIAEADIVIEAAFETMDVKRQVFAALDKHAKADAVLATNTSYLDVNAIARATARPQSVVGMHFFSPANLMRALEVVRGSATAPDVLTTAVAIGRKIGKAPAVVGVCHGFVGNRVQRFRTVEAERVLIEGALPQQVDAAMTEFGFPMGPLAAGDLAGLDISWSMRKAQGLRAEIADALCERGHYGQKTGRGFYRYEPGSRAPKPDPEVEQLIVETSARLGVTRRSFEKNEIVERLLFPVINEGARVLAEGIAVRPGDIDVIWVYGYAFPPWRGGIMHWADTLGLAYVRDRLIEFAARTGEETHKPAPLLAKLAAEGKGFAS
jgi:3-hydroxyacyl-CoA dehydrogenase